MEERKGTYRGGLVGPAILIGAGVVLLMNTLGIWPWSVWWMVLRLWPILLVAAGLDIILGRRSVWGSLLALVLTLAILAGVLWLFGTGFITGQAAATEEVSQALGEATRAEVVLAPAVGAVHVKALPESANLVEGILYLSSGERVRRDFAVAGETAKLSLRSEGTFAPAFGGWSERGWELKLNPDVLLKLEVSLGMGQTDVDLSGLTVSDLNVSMGLGQTTVVLPAEGRLRVKISGAIGQTTIVVPAGMEARIQASTGLAARQVPAGYKEQDDVYTSPGYAGAENRVDLEVSQAMGAVTIRH